MFFCVGLEIRDARCKIPGIRFFEQNKKKKTENRKMAPHRDTALRQFLLNLKVLSVLCSNFDKFTVHCCEEIGKESNQTDVLDDLIQNWFDFFIGLRNACRLVEYGGLYDEAYQLKILPTSMYDTETVFRSKNQESEFLKRDGVKTVYCSNIGLRQLEV